MYANICGGVIIPQLSNKKKLKKISLNTWGFSISSLFLLSFFLHCYALKIMQFVRIILWEENCYN